MRQFLVTVHEEDLISDENIERFVESYLSFQYDDVVNEYGEYVDTPKITCEKIIELDDVVAK